MSKEKLQANQKDAAKKPLWKSLLGQAKFLLAAGLIFVLIRSGKLSLQDVQSFLAQPKLGLLALAIIFVIYFCAIGRWRLLLKNVGVKLPWAAAIKLGMIGQFFSSIIPGSVGGDLVKAVYIARRYPGYRLKTISTIFIDRVLGLSGMLVLGALAFVGGFKELQALEAQIGNASVKMILTFGWVICFLAIGILLALSIFPFIIRRLPLEAPEFLNKLPLSKSWISLYDAAIAYRTHPAAFWYALVVSMFMHCLNISAMYIVAYAIFGPAPWGHLNIYTFSVAALLGLIASALPVAPMGVGVGQIAFAVLFSAVGAPSESFGASVVTGFQIVSLVANLSGALFFATYKHEIAALPKGALGETNEAVS